MLKPQTFWEKFFQLYLAVANFFSIIYGFCMVGLGVYSAYNPFTYGYGFERISVAICVVGAILMAISLLGCCGASCESRRMTFSVPTLLSPYQLTPFHLS